MSYFHLRTITALILCSLGFYPIAASAHISLMLHEAIGGAGETTSAGHAAVYLSNVCGNEITGLRTCVPGEPGVVIAAYPKFGLNKDYEWMAVPLPYYLYGLPDESDIPLYSNGKVRTLLRNSYRDLFLHDVMAPPPPSGTVSPKVRWNQMIGVVYNRDVYAFTLVTTHAEDEHFISAFNARPNVAHFSTAYHNCADFAMQIINTYFPKSVHADLLNDLTMATPKAVARQFALSLARKHPERNLTVQKFSQTPGPIHRSFDNRNFSEQAFRSKKYLITQAILNQELLGFFVGSYYLTGHFDPASQYKNLCTRNLASMQSVDQLPLSPKALRFISNFAQPNFAEPNSAEPNLAEPGDSVPALSIAAASPGDKARTFADVKTWNRYRAEFKPMLEKATAHGYFFDPTEISTFFRDLERQSQPEMTPDGLWLHVKAFGHDTNLGITAKTILSAGSDRVLAYKLLLCLVRADLDASEKNRNPIDRFQSTWALLLIAARDNQNALLGDFNRPFLDTPVVLPMKKRLLRDFLFITH